MNLPELDADLAATALLLACFLHGGPLEVSDELTAWSEDASARPGSDGVTATPFSAPDLVVRLDTYGPPTVQIIDGAEGRREPPP